MSRIISCAFVALWLWSLPACSSATSQRATATVLDVTGSAADRSLPVLTAQMKREGLTAVEVSEDRDDALLKLAKIRQAWAPVWVAYDSFSRLHDSAAGLVERGEELSLEHLSELARAYCDVREMVAEHGVDLPDIPLKSCGEEPRQ